MNYAVATQISNEGDLLDSYSRAVIEASETVSPSVVYIQVTARRESSGSGFVFTPDGFILTNSHVVHGGTKAAGMLMYGRKFPGQLIDDVHATDVAVIRRAAPILVYQDLGETQSIGVGQLVIAIGNPY